MRRFFALFRIKTSVVITVPYPFLLARPSGSYRQTLCGKYKFANEIRLCNFTCWTAIVLPCDRQSTGYRETSEVQKNEGRRYILYCLSSVVEIISLCSADRQNAWGVNRLGFSYRLETFTLCWRIALIFRSLSLSLWKGFIAYTQ